MGTTRWDELTKQQKAAIAVGAAVQLALLGAALADLRRRPASLVRGSKRAWTAAVFVNFVGPLAYFAFGRRRGTGA